MPRKKQELDSAEESRFVAQFEGELCETFLKLAKLSRECSKYKLKTRSGQDFSNAVNLCLCAVQMAVNAAADAGRDTD